jgi:hypothetical protein
MKLGIRMIPTVLPDGVGSQYSIKYSFRRDLAGFVMNAFARATGFLRDTHQSVAVKIPKTDVPKGGRQAYFFAEGEHDG